VTPTNVGYLTVDSVPGGWVFVDGIRTSYTAAKRIQVQPGMREIVIRNERTGEEARMRVLIATGVESDLGLVTLHAGTAAQAPMNAPVSAAKPGKLTIDSRPWGDVVIDGVPISRETPVVGLELAPGKHEILIRNSLQKVEKRMTVLIVAGETTKIGRVVLDEPMR
jgi:hypothetical protein